MANLLLLCNLERLKTWDDTSDSTLKAFGLNLSVAVDGSVDPKWLADDLQNPQASNPPMRAIFWPWKWSMPKVRVYLLDQNGARMKDQSGHEIPPEDITLTPAATTLDSVRAGMEMKFPESVSPSQAGLIYQLTSDRVSLLRQDDKNNRPWHTLLGKVSTFPCPVPQSLKLSYTFSAKIGPNVKKVFAAPLLAAGTPFPSAATSPGSPHAGSDPRVLIADYDGVPEIALKAYSAPCAIDVAAGDFIDPGTQWVNDPGANNYFDEDWLAALESRMADALDLSQALVLFLKDTSNTALLKRGDNLRLFARMTLAALADMTGPGFVPPPDGVRLIDKLLTAAQLAPLSQAEVTTLRGTVLYGSVADFRALLAGVFGAQNAASAYSMLGANPPRISLEQTTSELEGIQASLLEAHKDRNTLLAFSAKQWQQLFGAANLQARVAQVPKLQQMADTNYSAPAIRDLRRQLALSNLGRFWTAFIHCNPPGDANGRALVLKGFPLFMQYYLVQRFGLNIPIVWNGATPPPAGSVQFSPPWAEPVPADLAQAIFQHVQTQAGKLVTNLLPDLAPQAGSRTPPPAAAPAQPNETPHALTLQVEQLAPLQDESAQFSDVLNRFSGVGLLMRESGATEWLCLNRADLEVNGQILDIGGDPALVPLRITYRNELRQVCTSYDNRPLVADSPLSRKEIAGWVSGGTPSFYVLVTNRYSKQAKMPCLTFGRSYQFAIFAIANCGAIPRNLAGANWCTFTTSPLKDDATTGVAIRTVSYLRRVRIGASRITDLQQPDRPIQAPAIPATLRPRSRDFDALNLRESPPGDTTKQLSTGQMPLLLLSPAAWPLGTAKVDALVSRPGTSWDCWHRWAKPLVTDAVRQAVIADFFRTAKKNADESVTNRPSLTVDDPALASWFYFELSECQDDGTLKAIDHCWVPIAAPHAGATGLNSQRSPAVPFTCQFVPAGGQAGIARRPPVPSKRKNDSGLPEGAVVSAVEGHVYRLGIYCTLPESSVPRFASKVVNPVGPALSNDQDQKSYLLVSPQYLAIECATAPKIDPEIVWAALTADAASAASGQIQLSFGAVSPLLHRAEITRQVWRWQGRNTDSFHPGLIAPAPADLDDRTLAWEAVEFGDRPDVDSTIVPMRADKPLPNGWRTLKYTEVLQNRQGDSDLRGLHYRFSVTAFNRYEGLIPPSLPSAFTGVHTLPDGTKSQWNRVFVPCRRTDAGNAPRLRLILPLTESHEGPAPTTPGLLVVFDEPWHETGGIAERLQARIAMTADPSEDPANLQHYYLEAGPDPMVGHQPLRSDPILPSDVGDVVEWLPIAGPVGHYFDATNSGALFNCTSFIVPAPRFKTKTAAPDMRWVFAKLQFRRMVVKSLRTVTDKVTSKPRVEVADAVYSPYTDPVWTQFLPAFSIYEDVPFVPARVRFDLAGKVLSLSNSDGSACRLNAMPSDNGIFSLYVVLTRRVFDVTGRPDQEQFVGLFSQGSANQWNLLNADKIRQTAPDLGYRARVIEVQRPPAPAGSGPTLWDDLFQAPAGSDTPVRIVRISAPIDSLSTSQYLDSCGGT